MGGRGGINGHKDDVGVGWERGGGRESKQERRSVGGKGR